MGLDDRHYRLVPAGRIDEAMDAGAAQEGATRLVGQAPDSASWLLDQAPYHSAFPGCQDLVFRDYVHSAEVGPHGSYDLILVDGRARMDCLRIAAQLLRPKGALVLDNSERDRYQRGRALVPEEWRRLDFPGMCPYLWETSQTTVWVRPSGRALGAPHQTRSHGRRGIDG
jgi:hypothetical protein